MAKKRNRVKQTESLKDRLATFAEQCRKEATKASGPRRDELLKKARNAETAAHLDDWANSPVLQSPK